MSEAIRLSVAETNKLRAQLGLQLLPIEDSRSDKSDEPSDSANRKAQSEKSLSIQETNRLRRSLGLRLLDEDSIEASAPHLDNRDPTAGRGDSRSETALPKRRNTDQNPGMEIGHSAKQLSQLKDGEVFTLEDKDILDESDDVFVNEELIKQQKQASRDKDRFHGGGASRSAFPSFDEESEPEDDLQYLSVVGSTIQMPEKPVSESRPVPSGNVTQISGLFDDLESESRSKSSKSKTVKFKKTKGSTSRKRTNEEYQDIVSSASQMVTSSLALEEADIDEIEASLAKARQKKAKSRSQMTPAEIAAEARTHHRLDVIADLKDGLVFDQTKDFLDSLATNTAESDSASMPEKSSEIKVTLTNNLNIGEISASKHNEHASDVVAAVESAPLKSLGSSQLRENAASDDALSEHNNELQEHENASESANQDGLEIEAPKFGSVLSTLKYLRQTATMTSEAEKKANKFKHEKLKEQSLIRMKILAQERIVKEELLTDVNYTRLSPEEKEKIFDETLTRRLIQENIISDLPKRGDIYGASQQADELENYNPQVHIRHKDEAGQVMDQKQAWKALSHRYHGLAPKKVKRTKMKSRAERTVN